MFIAAEVKATFPPKRSHRTAKLHMSPISIACAKLSDKKICEIPEQLEIKVNNVTNLIRAQHVDCA